MSRTITKVKHHNGLTTIEWDEPNGKHDNAGGHVTDCPDRPNDEFIDALAQVSATVLGMMGITGKKFAEAFKITGVTVSKDGHGRRLFKPSAYFTLAYGGGMGVSLPLVRECLEGDEAGTGALTDIGLKKFEALVTEGDAYASQDRHQGELALDAAVNE